MSAPLEDVDNVEAFAEWTVRRGLAQGGKLTPDQITDAANEAVVLIYELHGDWDPERCERFSAFLLTYLPRKLISWWRVELRQSGRGSWNGEKNAYTYRGMVSLDDVGPINDDIPHLHTDSSMTVYGPEAA